MSAWSHRKAAVIALLVFCPALTASALDCPPYTKLDAPIGDADEIPEGWCAFYSLEQPGLFVSPLQQLSASLVPNTSQFTVRHISISSDGKWILFIDYVDNANSKTYLIRPDGSGLTEVNTWELEEPGVDIEGRAANVVGWHRNAPGGAHIFYVPGPWHVFERPVDLSGTVPVIGDSREILEFPYLRAGFTRGLYLIPFWLGASMAMVGDQCISRLDANIEGSGSLAMPAYITLADSGRTKGDSTRVYRYSSDTYTIVDNGDGSAGYLGCSFSMSWDGQFCLSNSGATGNACVPSKLTSPPTDHKGFMVTRFIRVDEAPMPIHDIILNPANGVSINWCPSKYRVGTYDEVDFDNYSFSNHPECVVGSLKGSKLQQLNMNPGLWFIHWPTNTWTSITGENTDAPYGHPAMFITDSLSARRIGQTSGRAAFPCAPSLLLVRRAALQSIALGPHARSVSLYALDGRLLWSAAVPQDTRAVVRIAVPASLAGRPVIAEYR